MKPGATALTVSPGEFGPWRSSRRFARAASRAKRHRQAEQPGLRRRIVGLADVALLADHRRDAHDPPGAAFEHLRQRGLTEEERAREVDLEHAMPVVVGHLQHRVIAGDPGVVDEDVEASVLLDHLPDDAPAVFGKADVAAVDAGLHAVRLDRLAGLRDLVLVAAVAGGDRGALLGERQADRGADAATAAGDERDPAGQLALAADLLDRRSVLVWMAVMGSPFNVPSAVRATRRCRARFRGGRSSRPSARCARPGDPSG